MPTITNIDMEEELKEYRIDPGEVRQKLSKLNPAKSSGPNNLHSKLLKSSQKHQTNHYNFIPKHINKEEYPR